MYTGMEKIVPNGFAKCGAYCTPSYDDIISIEFFSDLFRPILCERINCYQ